MNALTWVHLSGGLVALAAGTAAFALRKGGAGHASAGTWFCGGMAVLGISAALLALLKSPPELPLGGLVVCYFVATAWLAAHRRDGRPGRPERLACALVLVAALAILGSGLRLALAPVAPAGPPGPGALLALGSVCLLAGLGDLRYLRRGRSSARQRLARHLWRMGFAFFIATGSFFLGQQDVLPVPLRGSPWLFVPAFAPFVLMLYWLLRVRYAKPVPGAGPRDA